MIHSWDSDQPSFAKYKMRPGPDPKRRVATEWMTEEEIEFEHIKESQHWIDSGSGKLGKIYVEVLGCDGLPNLDTGGFLGNKTDAFVSIVFEDSVVQTDIIDDCKNKEVHGPGDTFVRCCFILTNSWHCFLSSRQV